MTDTLKQRLARFNELANLDKARYLPDLLALANEQQARMERLERALEPFAGWAKNYVKQGHNDADSVVIPIRVEFLRNACAALADGETK